MALFKGKLFQERSCAICGKKAGALTRIELTDGNCICSNCFVDNTMGVPKYITDHISNNCNLEDLLKLKEYIQYSREVLAPKFTVTTGCGKIYLDEKNKLFSIQDGFFSETVYYELKNVMHFNLEFVPEEIKKGVFKTTAIGSIVANFGMSLPKFYYSEIVEKNIKTPAKSTNLLNTKFAPETPFEIENFMSRFMVAWTAAVEESK